MYVLGSKASEFLVKNPVFCLHISKFWDIFVKNNIFIFFKSAILK